MPVLPRRPVAAVSTLALAGLAFAPLSLAAQGANLGFEQALPSGQLRPPAGWVVNGKGYELTVDTTTRLEGRASLRTRLVDTAARDAGETGPKFAVAAQRYPLERAWGRTLRLSGWIRTENVADGYAGLWMRVDGPAQRTLAFDNMNDRGPRGTTPWTRFVVEVPVDSGAHNVIFGVLHPGTGTAWFDSLHVEAVGPVLPRRVASAPAFEVPPRPAEDFARLLTDAELALPPDTAAVPAVDTAAAAWVRANARPIRSLGATTFDDLRFLRPILEKRRVVQLGESGHGVREFNMAKVRLIKYLHEELGYDVLAFESSLFECDRAGRRAAQLSAVDLMRECIFGVWHTEEVRTLFDYVRATQSTRRPLVLTGFDTQRSSALGGKARPGFLRDVVAKVDTAYAARVYAHDSTFGATSQDRARIARERDGIVAFYDSLATWLRANERRLAPSFRDDPMAPKLARQTAISMSFFARQLAAGATNEGTEIRDLGMADNLDFVLDELHPGKKVIVWAHNFHIQHRGFRYAGLKGAPRAAPAPLAGTVPPPRTMGTWVSERRGPEVYTVGFYMYRGSAATNARTVYPVRPAAEGGLEAILHRAPWRYAFVDLSRAERSPGTEWMFSRITAKEWGTNTQFIVPREEYDGLLFIDTTWPPEYLRK